MWNACEGGEKSPIRDRSLKSISCCAPALAVTIYTLMEYPSYFLCVLLLDRLTCCSTAV